MPENPASEPAPSSKRLHAVDALRGIAALAVCWYHFTHGNPGFLPEGWLKETGTYGWLGVPVFFVISGFVVPYSMHVRRYTLGPDTGRFVLRRIVRLDPPYFAAVILTWGLWLLASKTPWFAGQPPDVTVAQMAAHVGYLNDFVGEAWLNPVFWTLAIEFQFYLLAALIFPLLSSRRTWVCSSMAILFGLGALAVRDSAVVFSHLALFGIGAAGFQLRTGHLGAAGYAACMLWLAAVTAGTGGTAVLLAALATAGVILMLRRRPWSWCLWLGSISYSLYLVHVPVGGRIVNIGTRFDASLPIVLLVLTAAMVGSLCASAVLHRYVEQPAQRWAASIRYRIGDRDKSRSVSVGSHRGTVLAE
ncbi:MAG: acyltransferase family protein [Vicinamibacterales bacterium]